MKKILVIGAGRSASTLISYLLEGADENNWFVTVADFSLIIAQESVKESNNANAIFFNVKDDKQREREIIKSDIVVSMLPASMHIMVAKDCVRLKKNLVTASYVSEEIAQLDVEATKMGVLLLNEIGLDPGIDHMSAMKIIDEIKEKGGELTSFKSFCGGLVHPDYDNNPWNYKFTWNPRNVVLAGQGVARYLEGGKIKFIPYNNLFERVESMNILNVGSFEAYANRDSLSYRQSYGIENIDSLLRGTLRREGYSKSWNYFVQLGLTDDSYTILNSENLTYREYLNMFLPISNTLNLEEKFCKEFVSYMGGKGYADAVTSGTAAIYTSLQALNLKKGSEVLITAVTDCGPLNCIIQLGLTPKIVDTAKNSYNSCIGNFISAISNKTKCVIATHAAGESIHNIDKLQKINNDLQKTIINWDTNINNKNNQD